MRRCFPYGCVVNCLTLPPLFPLPGHTCHEFGEPHQVFKQRDRVPSSEDHLWIRSDIVGPRPRHRANALVIDLQQEPHPVPVVALPNADQPLPTQRMEWVRHLHKTPPHVRKACSS